MKTPLLICFLLHLTRVPLLGSFSSLPGESIVRFNGYFDEKRRLEILKEAFSSSCLPIEKRNTYLSDFEVVDTRLITSSLKHHPLIRDVHYFNTSSTMKLSAKQLNPTERRRPGYDILTVANKLRADRLWAKGYTGKGIKVAIFDTGLTANRMLFKNVMAERDYTDENSPSDQLGHGTFVAGIVAGTNRRCPGLAPDAELYIYKVFGRNQESRTKWFLDALNDAIQQKVDVINLSIGGADYMDKLFMEKVDEVVSRGIVFVSAVGNDGPLFGSVNNPADHPAVVGVGAINSALRVANFSSRGITTQELPGGYGRLKPNIVTFGVQLRAAARNGGCRFMSGTSVAAPVITGSIALLLSSIPPEKRNSMRIHQILNEGSERLEGVSMFEQGAGQFDLLTSFVALQSYTPQITFSPSYLDTTDCPYMWPYCSQPLFFGSMPFIVNVTIHNGFDLTARIKRITFEYTGNQRLLDVSVEYSNQIDNVGYLAVFISAKRPVEEFDGIEEGRLNVEFELKDRNSSAQFPIRVNVAKTPPKSKRILWDTFRNLYYPLGYYPRDNLRSTKAPLDIFVDHPHTNYHQLYKILREHGYFVEAPGQPLVCIDLSEYGNLLIVDPEDEYFPQEVQQIQHAVEHGLNLIVVGDWYSEFLLENIKFEDPSSRKFCYPESGGSNVPALNDLINNFGFALGDQVLEGPIKLFDKEIRIASGAEIKMASPSAWIGRGDFKDIVAEAINQSEVNIENAAVFGIDWPSNNSGFVAVFGDSNCFETAIDATDATDATAAAVECSSILIELLNLDRDVDGYWKYGLEKSGLPPLSLKGLPKRITKSNFANSSRVADRVFKSYITYKQVPRCPRGKEVEGERTESEIRFGNRERLKKLQSSAAELFKGTISNHTDLLTDSGDISLDYLNEESIERRARNLVRHYIHRLVYFISIVFLLLAVWLTCLPRHRIGSLVCRPLMRLLNSANSCANK